MGVYLCRWILKKGIKGNNIAGLYTFRLYETRSKKMSAQIIEGGIIIGIILGVLQLFFNIFRLKKKPKEIKE
ncbi:MAG: hypothetical protein ACHQW9_00040 [Nitrososphaerales archaeon]